MAPTWEHAWQIGSQTALVPGIVDAATLQWALQKKLGDVLEYRDERGESSACGSPRRSRTPILQGSVLIAEQRLRATAFPSQGGYRFFLVDAPSGAVPSRARGT